MSTHPDDPRPLPGGDVASGGDPNVRTSNDPNVHGAPGQGMQPGPERHTTGDRDGWGVAPAQIPAGTHDDAQARTAPHPRAEGWDGSREQHERERAEHDRIERQGAGPGHGDQDGDARSSSTVDDAVQTLAQPDNRAKLLLAIAVMTALTLLLVLVIAIDQLTDEGPDPVLVEGVPCLVETGEDDQAVLYCQR